MATNLGLRLDMSGSVCLTLLPTEPVSPALPSSLLQSNTLQQLLSGSAGTLKLQVQTGKGGREYTEVWLVTRVPPRRGITVLLPEPGEHGAGVSKTQNTWHVQPGGGTSPRFLAQQKQNTHLATLSMPGGGRVLPRHHPKAHYLRARTGGRCALYPGEGASWVGALISTNVRGQHRPG